MSYTPLDINIYSAAFSGAMAGLSVPTGTYLLNSTQANYANQAAVAAFFAQAVDTAWAGAASNDYDVYCILQSSANFFRTNPGYPLTQTALNTQANWTSTAQAVVAMVQEGDVVSGATQNITLAGSANLALGEGGATTAAAGTITRVAAIKLVAKSSGLFKAACTLAWSALAAADVGTISIQVFTDNVAGTPLTLSNVGQVGFGSDGFAEPGHVAVTNNGPFTSSAGAGITLTGENGGYAAHIESITQGTAAVGAVFSWSGIVGAAAAAAATPHPLPIGKTCLVTIALTNSVAPRATGNISLSMFEL